MPHHRLRLLVPTAGVRLFPRTTSPPDNLLDIPSIVGRDDIDIAVGKATSGGEGFSFDYAATNLATTPLPATWTMTLMGLAGPLVIPLPWRRSEGGTRGRQ
jgi:hypothetical protein